MWDNLSMTIECFADPEAPILGPAMSVLEAADILRKEASAYGFVVSSGRPVGLFLPEDVLPRLDRLGLDPADATVCQWMNTRVASFYSDCDHVEAIVTMVEKGDDLAVVQDRNGVITGFLDRALLDYSGRSIPFLRMPQEQLRRSA